MEKLDEMILRTVAERVFTPERVEGMMKELQGRLKASRDNHHDKLKELFRELDEIKQRTDNLYDAVEKGLLPVDESLSERAHKHQARRQEILVDIAWQQDKKK